MRSALQVLAFCACLFVAVSALAATRYVDANSTSPAAPYTSWATAARVIQDAVDVAVTGDEVLVTNGLYATGGSIGSGSIVNRVAVNTAISVRSVNGPQFTLIQGQQSPGTTNGPSAIRCVSLSDGASLLGFTLTNGATFSNTGYYWRDQHGGGLYCESTNSLASNCVIIANSAGADGGGVFGGTVKNCVLARNWTYFYGGGAAGSTANGGTPCILKSCVLTANSAAYGGGVSEATVINCTITGNNAWNGSGGAYTTTLSNCIVYFNNAVNNPNYSAGLDYCCTTPLPATGVGNIDLDPQLADLAHISPASPCRGAGRPNSGVGVDFDGETWLKPPSIGCDEYYPGSAVGPLSVSSIRADFTNVAVGFVVNLAGAIVGHAQSNSWDFADGTRAANRLQDSHSWAAPGDYPVVFNAYNESNPGGVSATVTVHIVSQAVHYVVAGNPNAAAPYSSWATAAAVIQDAIDATTLAGAQVLVTNGVYATGGRVAAGRTQINRVAINKPIIVRSVNGAQVTFIQGYQVPGAIYGDEAIRCAYLTNGARLSGFTLTNGSTRSVSSDDHFGGAVWGELSNAVVSDCVLSGNAAYAGGGGAYQAILTNCTLSGNWSAGSGGGTYSSVLVNCLLTNNVATNSGGGVFTSSLSDCALSDNRATTSGGGASFGRLYNCVLSGNTTPGSGGGADESFLFNCNIVSNSADAGGGVAEGVIVNSLLTGNWASGSGGGAYAATLYNCTLAGNSAGFQGGGGYGFDSFHVHANCTLYNSIAYSNSAPVSPDCVCTQYDSCLPSGNSGVGRGNINDPPQFVNAAAGDFRLQPTSPCINSGNNSWLTNFPGSLDLDGHARIVGGAVDIGAYEVQNPSSVISYAWLRYYGFPVDGSADYADVDNDGMNNFQEWRTGTGPTNSASALRLLSPTRLGADVLLTWQSVYGKRYLLERSTNLGPAGFFSTLSTNIDGQWGSTSYTDTNAASSATLFYRVGVEN